MKKYMNIQRLLPSARWSSLESQQAQRILGQIALSYGPEILDDVPLSDKDRTNFQALTVRRAIEERMGEYYRLLASGQARRVRFSGSHDGGFRFDPTFDNYVKDFLARGTTLGDYPVNQINVKANVIRELQLIRDLGVLGQSSAIFASEVKDTLRRSRLAPPRIVDSEPRIAVLHKGAYLKALTRKIQKASASISIVAFIMSSGRSPDHPVNRLVGMLIAARRRGVGVRVLLDRDGPEDIFNTRNINSPAYKRLRAARIDVHCDEEKPLTHSKLIVIDSRFVFIGSHNLTAASLTEYEETSVLVEDARLGAHYESAIRERVDECRDTARKRKASDVGLTNAGRGSAPIRGGYVRLPLPS